MLKAIDTRYKGYKFRSRLEARWAIFFDALHITWAYEQEGFHLHSGRYLPDFFLPDVCDRDGIRGVWVEIKGSEPNTTENSLCEELCHASKRSVVLLVGPPKVDQLDGEGGDGGYQWTYGPDGTACWDLGMVLHYCTGCRSGSAAKFEFLNDYYLCPKCGGATCTWDSQAIRDAAEKAREARFEHGETPR